MSNLNNLSTGFYQPVVKILPYGEELPSYRDVGNVYVTEEHKTSNGKRYNLDAMLALDNYLKITNSEWTIPTFDEINSMLNALEKNLCPQCENLHGGIDIGVFQGNYAGLMLRDEKWSKEEWEKFATIKYFFNALPHNEGKTFTGFWTKTKNNEGYWSKSIYDIDEDKKYAKIFQNLVINNTEMLPIRLLKNINSYTDVYEKINDEWYKTCILPSLVSENVWLGENINISKETLEEYAIEGYNNIAVEDNSSEISKLFVLNKWNGEKWEEHKIKEGEKFILLDDQEEYILKNQELVKSLQNVYNRLDNLANKDEELENNINSLDEKINATKAELTGVTSTLDEKINTTKTELSGATSALDKKIDETRTDLEDIITGVTNALNDKINNTKSELSGATSGLDEKINTTKTELENKLSGTTSSLNSKINETNDRIDDVKKELEGKIDETKTDLNQKIDDTKTTLEREISEGGKVKDVKVKKTEGGEYESVLDEFGVAKIDISQGGGGGQGIAYIQQNILDKNGNVLIKSGTTLTNAVVILTDTINNTDDDISVTYDEQGKNPRIRINGISND